MGMIKKRNRDATSIHGNGAMAVGRSLQRSTTPEVDVDKNVTVLY